MNKGITQIQYNHLNLPSRIAMVKGSSTSTIDYVYSASGAKLRVIHRPNVLSPLSTTTDYINGYIFTNNLSIALTDNGYYTLSRTGDPTYYFYLKDHQGNNRVVVSQSGSVEQTNHYYPYGALFAESTNGDIQRFKYNGKELDRKFGLDWYDHGARHNDAVIGRWHSMDPMVEKYYGISPYAYCGGNPVNFGDYNGKEWRIETLQNGNYRISLDVTLSNNTNLSEDEVKEIQQLISSTFNDMISTASNGKITGMVTFNGNQVHGQITPTLYLFQFTEEIKAGQNSYDQAVVFVNDNSGKRNSSIIASDAVHELLHTAGLDDITTTTQSLDTTLYKGYDGGYYSSFMTDRNIRSNIMNSPGVKIDGETFRSSNPNQLQNSLTAGQLDFLIQRIYMLMNGAGTHGQTDPFWETVGIPVI